MFRGIASFAIFGSVLACGDPPGQITVESTSAAVGIPTLVGLDASFTDCDDGSYWSYEPTTHCTSLDVPLFGMSAHCDDDACEVDLRDRKLRVIGRKPGPATLRVRALNGDGRVYEGAGSLSFATPSGLAVVPDARPDGSTFAAMIGAEARWRVALEVDGRPSVVASFDVDAIRVEATGNAVDVMRGSAPGSFDLAFARPGTASVRFSLGPFAPFAKTIDVRVAEPSEVVAIELHAARPRPSPLVVDPDALSAITVDRPRTTFASVLVLRDGTKALGGAGLFRVVGDAPGLALSAHDGRVPDSTQGPLDPLGAAFVDLHPDGGKGSWRIEAVVGDARGEWEVAAR